jgi:hypothetical protein
MGNLLSRSGKLKVLSSSVTFWGEVFNKAGKLVRGNHKKAPPRLQERALKIIG